MPPPALIFPPKSPDKNSDIANLVSIVEKSKNYFFEDDLIPHSLQEGLKVMNFVYCLHRVLVIGKYTDIFWGEDGGNVGGSSCGGREFSMRGGGISRHY